MSLDPLLNLRGVSREFKVRGGTVKAVSDVDMHIMAGETLGLVGESGSGKSTLGRLTLRLIEPTAGECTFDDVSLYSAKRKQLLKMRRRMQMIFQDPYASLNRYFNIERTLMEPLTLHKVGKSRAERRELVVDMLEKVGFGAEVLQRYPSAFSGGQRQRIGIARALILRPNFVVADESVSALDVSVQAQILNILADLRDEMGLTMLFITHDLSVVRQVADRIMVLYLGRVVEIAPTESLFAAPAHPYSRTLIAAAPSLDRIDAEPLAGGEIPSPLNPPSGCPFRTRCAHAISACADSVPQLRQVQPGHVAACIRDDIPTFAQEIAQ